MSENRHGMKGWGTLLGADLNEPKTLEEAQLLATMSCADRLYELLDVMRDVQARLTRLEVYVEENAPGYTRTSAYLAQPTIEPIQTLSRESTNGRR